MYFVISKLGISIHNLYLQTTKYFFNLVPSTQMFIKSHKLSKFEDIRFESIILIC